MPETPRRFLLLLRSNWVSWIGAITTTSSFLSMVVFYFMLSMGYWGGPYLGMFAFLILPGFFVIGLLMVPTGLVIYRAKLAERIELVTHKPLKLIRAIAILTIINLVAVGTAGYEGMHYMDSVEFCGTLCHEVMQPQYDAYLGSPHARVNCVDCHIGPGASWFVKSKLSGARQVFAVLFDTYQKPTPTPVESLRPARETCEQCHWPERFQGDKLVVRTHFGTDREVTPYSNVLVMKTGGTRPDGSATGIHWHVHSGVEVQYYATDEKRMEIPWVKLIDKEAGREEIFTLEGVDAEPPADAEIRTMDCLDCHNQPSHKFERMEDALDGAIGSDLISRRLPFVKKIGMDALSRTFSRETAADEIRGVFEAFYTGEEALSEDLLPLLDAAVSRLAEIYLRNIYPDMQVTWDTYRSLTGHFGCKRCHAEKHVSASGRAIPINCNNCHVILAREQENPSILEELGLTPHR